MSLPRLYTLVVSGERITLTKDQLLSDPDNYFFTYFFGDFSESQNNPTEIIIEKEPALFKLIQAHLRGYTVLPIPEGFVPAYMTRDTMVQNLLVEAEYYGLEELVGRITEYLEKQTKVDERRLLRRNYKLGRLSISLQSSWKIGDIPDRGAELLLQRIYTTTTIIPVSGKCDSLECPGYRIAASWSDIEAGSDFALLEPEDVME